MRTFLIALLMTLATQAGASDLMSRILPCYTISPGAQIPDVIVTVRFKLTDKGKVIRNSLQLLNFSGNSQADGESAFLNIKRAILRCQKQGYPVSANKSGDSEVTLVFNLDNLRGKPAQKAVDSSRVVNAKIIFELKSGHLKSCIPTVEKQFKSIGVPINSETLDLYCSCLGNLYFNDLTQREYKEMLRIKELPSNISRKRRDFQNYCADLHFK